MKRRFGFTLVELLVVIAIIAVLAAILFPAFIAVRKGAHKAACLSNMKQLLMAQKMYSDDQDRTLVPARTGGAPGTLGYTWCLILQPYMKNSQILVCPDDPAPQQAQSSTDLPHSYGINYNLTFNSTYGQAFVQKMSGINNTSGTLLFFDLIPSAQAMGSSYYTSGTSRMDTRHSNQCGVGFLDGHAKVILPAETVKPVNMWLPS